MDIPTESPLRFPFDELLDELLFDARFRFKGRHTPPSPLNKHILQHELLHYLELIELVLMKRDKSI